MSHKNVTGNAESTADGPERRVDEAFVTGARVLREVNDEIDSRIVAALAT